MIFGGFAVTAVENLFPPKKEEKITIHPFAAREKVTNQHVPPTDWIKVYNNYKSREGNIIRAREMVVLRIINDRGGNMSLGEARDFLEDIIVKDVERQIAEQNKRMEEIRRQAS